MASRFDPFVFEVKYGDSDTHSFFVRGLTVGEYIGVAASGILDQSSLNRSFFIRMANTCVVDWSGFYDGDHFDETGEYIDLPFTTENFEAFPDTDFVVKLGQMIWNEFTSLSELEYKKIKGHIRFIHYQSAETKVRRADFDCKECVRTGMYVNRRCGLGDSRINEIKQILVAEDKLAEESLTSNSGGRKSRGRGGKGRGRGNQKVKREPSQVRGGTSSLNLGGFLFPECPISWVGTYLREVANSCYFAVKNNYLLFGSDLSSTPRKVYEIYRVVLSESSAIEVEEMKKKE